MFITTEELDTLQERIYHIHISKNASEFKDRIKDFDNYYDCKNDHKIYKYMQKMWLNTSKFDKR